jgi:hypothetical protein
VKRREFIALTGGATVCLVINFKTASIEFDIIIVRNSYVKPHRLSVQGRFS